jgi:hypothetical protein
VIRIEFRQLAFQPRNKARIAGKAHAIAPASVVLNRLSRNYDADHSRSLTRAKIIAFEAPGHKNNHVLAAARCQYARVIWYLQLDEISKVIAVIFHCGNQRKSAVQYGERVYCICEFALSVCCWSRSRP